MRDRTKVALSAGVLAVIAALFVFHPFTPNFPFAGVDPSWVAVTGEAADRPARWGIDTVFTYGPASPLVTNYYNAGYLTRTLPLLLGFSALFGWCAALLIAGPGVPGRSAAAGTAATGVMILAAHGRPDALYLALPFLAFLLALRSPGPERAGAARIAASLGAVAMGLTAMAKMSFPLAAAALFVPADAAQIARRRWPWLVPPFALGIVGGALLYGQRLADLPTYAAMQGEVVAGYAAAMAISGPAWDILPFLALAAALTGAVIVAGWRRKGSSADAWLVPLGLAIDLLFLFKAGFIRHDLHSPTAWIGLALVGTILGWAWLPRPAALAVTGAASIVALVYAPVFTIGQSGGEGRGPALSTLYRDWLVEAPRREIVAALDWLADPAGIRSKLDEEKAVAWADIAAAAPLPALAGTVDVIPSEQSRVMASGLDYRGRPSFQEYSTYTARLAAANRAFVAGPDAPRWMLFGPETPLGDMALDDRYPGFAEGALWPDLLRLYRPDHRIGALVALERRAMPAPLPWGPVHAAKTGFGDVTPVPDGTAPVWATLDIRLNLAGRALSALFRPPLVQLDVRLDDGTERWFRFVPDLAAAGFLLSPRVDNASDYEALATGRAAPAGRRVVAVGVQTSRLARLFYESDVAVTLRTIDTAALAAGAPARSPPATAWEALADANSPPSGGRIAAPPSAAGPATGLVSLPLWRLPVVEGRRHVALGYGVADGDAVPKGEVCFALRPADGTRGTLWHRCLAPEDGAPRSQAFALDVPERVGELVLETRCAVGCPAKAAYWAKPPDVSAAER